MYFKGYDVQPFLSNLGPRLFEVELLHIDRLQVYYTDLESKVVLKKTSTGLYTYLQTKTPHNFHLLSIKMKLLKAFYVYINLENQLQIFVF